MDNITKLRALHAKKTIEDIVTAPVEYTKDTFVADIDLSPEHQEIVKHQGMCDKAHHIITEEEWRVA